jgi:hypothetical protein
MTWWIQVLLVDCAINRLCASDIRRQIDDIVGAGSFNEIGLIAGGSSTYEDGTLADFTPGNFLLGYAQVCSVRSAVRVVQRA